MIRVEKFDDVALYLGDCREIMPVLKRPDALVSDPPYGQKLNANIKYRDNSKTTRVMQRNGAQLSLTTTTWPSTIIGDDAPFDPTPLLSEADRVLLWGAHRFAHRLPVGSWLVWDKVPNGKVRSQGDGEAAWINDAQPRPMRIHRLLWDGLCVGSGARHEVTAGQKRVHPTQKPEILMRWCIEQLRLKSGSLVCDPYMGAGSTGVAAVQLGMKFVGIELEAIYFDTACRRLEKAILARNAISGEIA